MIDDGDEPARSSAGRHPVVEAMLHGRERFVPNDTALGPRTRSSFSIITGPNMAGKSTYMRQVALIVADGADRAASCPRQRRAIGLVDRIFTRVGASRQPRARPDHVHGGDDRDGEHPATTPTARSLVILDEIGRGTSTFDGLSIAWAVAEYLHDTSKVARRRCSPRTTTS